MKTFLRFTAIIFLIVLGVVVVTSGPKSETIVPEELPLEETISEENTESVEPEETLEEIIDPAGDEDDGAIILGGDGIPNN